MIEINMVVKGKTRVEIVLYQNIKMLYTITIK